MTRDEEVKKNFGYCQDNAGQIKFDLNERCYPTITQGRVLQDHLARYYFINKYISNKIVLDIACGEGYGCKIIKEGGAAKVYGADNNQEIVDQAKLKYPGINFVVSEATDTPFMDNFFDIVVSFETWHHLDLYAKFIPEISRILKPGGLLILSVPNEKIIYLNPLNNKLLTKYYRVNFDKKRIKKYFSSYFEIKEWYGQRFVKIFYTFFITKLFLFILTKISRKMNDKINIAFKRADGPAVKILKNNNARYLIVVSKNIK